MAIDYDGGLTCALSVKNLEAGVAWYRDVLGFEPLYVREDIAWGELQTGVAKVNVGLSQVEEPGGKGGATLTFGVTDIDAAKAALDAKGFGRTGRSRRSPAWSACLPSTIPTAMR